MKLTFRWYGLNDSIPLDYIRQIPNMSGVVTAVYDVPVGEVWPLESLEKLKKEANSHGLEMEVIESIPVHEDIKLGKATRDHLIDNYIENIRRVAQVGVKCVCYNFMPVFDWLRTNMHHVNEDTSNSLSYSYEEFLKVDPNNLHLPGWDESYSPAELQDLLNQYRSMTHDDLFDNLVYFLNRIIPVCDEVDVKMAIHPDDPPWDIFGLPRIVSTKTDLERMFKAVPSLNNGVTFCTGSFGAGRENDLLDMVDTFSKEKRVHFVHLRNVKYTDEYNSFCEVGHYSKAGSLDIGRIVKILVNNSFEGYVRPDHGRNIFGEDGKPGYGLYDRALGCAYINGLFEAFEKAKEDK
jgi:mannonate dehydratase